jgi:hypothetical protein
MKEYLKKGDISKGSIEVKEFSIKGLLLCDKCQDWSGVSVKTI